MRPGFTGSSQTTFPSAIASSSWRTIEGRSRALPAYQDDRMGLFTKEALDALVASGCTGCGGTRLMFQTYVDGLVPLMGGEPVGKLKWAYDGEAFCDGIFAIDCL